MRNSIPAALLASQFERLLPKLEHVTLKGGDLIYRADQKIEYMYFPEEAVVAMIDSMDDGAHRRRRHHRPRRTGGHQYFPGRHRHPRQGHRATRRRRDEDEGERLAEGNALWEPAAAVTSGLARTFLAVISQSVACNSHHQIGQRLARLLLTMSDYAGLHEFLMVQESIAGLLGVRRVGVTEAALELQADALIRYRRGGIRILDRPRLLKRSCECYRFIRQQYKQLLDELPRLLSRK